MRLKATPAITATVKSIKTVSKKVTMRHVARWPGKAFAMRRALGASDIFHATTNKMAASEAKGIFAAKGAKNRIMNIRNSECTTPASGPVPPLRTLVAVRAIAPVAAKPPKRGAKILARPWPMSY